jgi:Formin Homology 2 Domain
MLHSNTLRDAGDFDSTQLMALKEFLPSDEERGALGNYVKDLPASEEEKEKGISVLPACEKYMIAMMDVKNAQAKFDCMLFGVQFQNLLDELVQGIKTVRKACDDVRHSEKLRKMMAMILTLVNQINTGGDGTLALGFSLEALSKLGEAKAFDKKTSVLHYLAKLIRQNDESLLTFADDVISIAPAVTVVLDGLVGDMKMINEQLTKVMETTISEADILEAEGKLPTLSISMISDTKQVVEGDEDGDKTASKSENDISENPETQSAGTGEESQNDALDTISPPPTTISKNENVCEGSDAPKMRTPMERFVHQAKREVDDAIKSLEELKTRYSDLLKYFGEDENLQSNEFFGTLQKFIIEFHAAAEQVEKAEKGKVR